MSLLAYKEPTYTYSPGGLTNDGIRDDLRLALAHCVVFERALGIDLVRGNTAACRAGTHKQGGGPYGPQYENLIANDGIHVPSNTALRDEYLVKNQITMIVQCDINTFNSFGYILGLWPALFISGGPSNVVRFGINTGTETIFNFSTFATFTAYGMVTVAVLYDGIQCRAYINGADVGGVSKTGNLNWTGHSGNLTILTANGDTDEWQVDGNITFAGVWFRALPMNEFLPLAKNPWAVFEPPTYHYFDEAPNNYANLLNSPLLHSPLLS